MVEFSFIREMMGSLDFEIHDGQLFVLDKFCVCRGIPFLNAAGFVCEL
jgi:hypothetical protein